MSDEVDDGRRLACIPPDMGVLLDAALAQEPDADDLRLLGMVMKASRGGCNPKLVRDLIRTRRTSV